MTESERNLLLAVAHILRTPYSHLDELIEAVESRKALNKTLTEWSESKEKK